MKPKRHEQSRSSKQTRKKTAPATRAEARKKIEISAQDLARYLEARRVEPEKLLRTIKAELKALEGLLRKTSGWEEDCVYRFYHQSFKGYFIQKCTEDIVAKLQSLAPHLPLNTWFMDIVREGTGHEFSMKDNEDWLAITRPMFEAYWHARYFLEMTCKYGRQLKSAPDIMPSGWAAVLYLYRVR